MGVIVINLFLWFVFGMGQGFKMYEYGGDGLLGGWCVGCMIWYFWEFVEKMKDEDQFFLMFYFIDLYFFYDVCQFG